MTHQHTNVLLVEDNPGDARLIKELLAQAGASSWNLECLDRLSTALKRLDMGGIDVILLDLSLPDSQGLETFLEAYARAPDVPIVVLTGLDDETLAVKAVREGAQDYLVKGQVVGHLLARSIRYAIRRKQAEEEKTGLEAQLRFSKKLEAVGQLAGGIAHDFNNLLTVITGYSHILLARLGQDDPSRHEIEQIDQAGARAAGLTRQLLAFSRKQVLKPKVLDLNELVATICRLLQRLIGEDITLITSPAPALWRVKADPGQLEQVLMNLAVNARDAMPEGGKIIIETQNVELDAAYASAHDPILPGSYVMLAVSDTGCGMDAETQTHMFEPFFTTKEPGKGTGLGLATVYGVVKQSGGYVWLYSELGIGTTVKIFLPPVTEELDRAPSDPRPAETLRGSETILLVEDEGMVRNFVQTVLQTHGYTVLAAWHGGEALRLSQEHAGPIALLLTDMVMPGMNGRETANRLVATRPETRVLYMSGYTDKAIVQHGMRDPGTAFLQKPLTPNVLAEKVREVLAS